MTNRKAPESVMRNLCECVLEDRRWNSTASHDALNHAVDAYRAATAPLPPPDLARLLRRLHVETQRCNACVAGECDWHDLQRVVRAFTTLSEEAQSAAYDCRHCSETTDDEL